MPKASLHPTKYWQERCWEAEDINADLLAALEAAEQYLAFHSEPNCEPVPLQQVRDAIAKAKPETKE